MDRPYHHLSSALDIESSLPAGRRLCYLPAVKLAKDRHNYRKIGKRFAKPNAQGPRFSGAMSVDLTRIIVAEFTRVTGLLVAQSLHTSWNSWAMSRAPITAR